MPAAHGIFDLIFTAMAMFDSDAFVDSCQIALLGVDPRNEIRELVERAISFPQHLDQLFPVPLDPDEDGIIFRSSELTVTSAIFPRGFTTGIHNHTMAAVIGVWSGIEDNHLYAPREHGVTATGTKRVVAGEVLVLTDSDIHDVQVPNSSWSCALHVYLGDLIASQRNGWASNDSPKELFDADQLRRRWLEVSRDTGLTTVSPR